MGIVVLREVPRRRDTLLLRLLGRGRVLREAIADLKALPTGAREREVALPALVALRFEVKQDPTPDDETRAFLMATSDLYEQWEKRVTLKGKAEGLALGEARGEARGKAEGKAEGLALGVATALIATYEARFGPMSQSLRKAVGKVAVPESADAWVKLFVTASREEIAAAIRKKQPPSP